MSTGIDTMERIVVVHNENDPRKRYEFIYGPLSRLVREQYPDVDVSILRQPPRLGGYARIFREAFAKGVRGRWYIACFTDVPGLLWTLVAKMRGGRAVLRFGGNQPSILGIIRDEAFADGRIKEALWHMINFIATRIAMKNAAAILVVCQHLADEFEQQGNIDIKTPVFVIPQIVRNLDLDTPLAFQYPKQPRQIRLLTVTNLKFTQKSVPLEAFLRMGLDPQWKMEGLPPVRYDILGGGRYESDVRRQVDELSPELKARGIEINVHGYIDDVDSWFKRADLFLYASERDYLPNSILEAQRHGLPIVANDYASLMSMMKDRTNAMFCRTGDSADSARIVSSLLHDYELMKELAEANYNDVRRIHSPEGVMQHMRPMVDFFLGTGKVS